MPSPKYDPENVDFKNFVKTIALSTTAFFAFNPNNDVVRAAYAKANKISPDSIPKENIPDEIKKEFETIRKKMVDDEIAKPFFKRKTEGDASETGLVKFIQPLLLKEYGGMYENGLDEIREKFPIIKYGADNKLAQIPFSSDIKFNCLIRDANTAEQNPSNTEDNITVFLKGAPDRVITRCTHVLVRGKEVPIDASILKQY